MDSKLSFAILPLLLAWPVPFDTFAADRNSNSAGNESDIDSINKEYEEFLHKYKSTTEKLKFLTQSIESNNELILAFIAEQATDLPSAESLRILKQLSSHVQSNKRLPNVSEIARREIIRAQYRIDVQTARDIIEKAKSATDLRAYLISLANSDNEVVLSWIASRLGNYDDAEVIAILRKLEAYKPKYFEPGSDPLPVIAHHSLDKIASNKDLSSLRSTEQLKDVEPIVIKYAFSDNGFAREQIIKFCIVRANKDPASYIPMLVKYFAYDLRVQTIVSRNVKFAESAISDGLLSPDPYIVSGCLKITKDNNLYSQLQNVTILLLADTNAFATNNIRLRFEAMDTIENLGNRSVPYLERYLYARNSLYQVDCLRLLSHIGTSDAWQALDRFAKYYEHLPPTDQDHVVKANIIKYAPKTKKGY